jgi:hypothetical protein
MLQKWPTQLENKFALQDLHKFLPLLLNHSWDFTEQRTILKQWMNAISNYDPEGRDKHIGMEQEIFFS